MQPSAAGHLGKVRREGEQGALVRVLMVQDHISAVIVGVVVV